MYLEAWSGKEGFRADRLTRQAAPVEKLCLSVFGGTQPGVLMPHMQSAYGRNRSADGFMQRFQLAVISTSTPPYRNDDREPNTEAKKGVTETFKLIDRADFMAFGAFADDQMRFYVRFTPEAQQVFLDWLERNHHFVQQLNAEQDEPLGSHFAKYNKLVPALALLFYLVECASQPASVTTGPAVVSLSALTYALRWGDFLALHARAIYQLGRSQAVDEASIAARILDQFRQGAFKEGETVRNVARAFGRSEHEAKEAIGELEELGWLRVETVKAHKGRPSIRVRLHPKFAAEIDSHSRR